MIQLQPIRTDSLLYPFMESLLIHSFPIEEYRDLEALRIFTDHTPNFHNHVITDDGSPIGILTYWWFGEFYYIEHFAIHPDYRNGGYGGKTLQHLFTLLQHPIVLEVEVPNGETEQRRIQFYQRQGFALWTHPYQQPPYRPEGEYLPMHLMAHGNLQCPQDFEKVKERIYREVYLISSPE